MPQTTIRPVNLLSVPLLLSFSTLTGSPLVGSRTQTSRSINVYSPVCVTRRVVRRRGPYHRGGGGGEEEEAVEEEGWRVGLACEVAAAGVDVDGGKGNLKGGYVGA